MEGWGVLKRLHETVGEAMNGSYAYNASERAGADAPQKLDNAFWRDVNESAVNKILKRHHEFHGNRTPARTRFAALVPTHFCCVLDKNTFHVVAYVAK